MFNSLTQGVIEQDHTQMIMPIDLAPRPIDTSPSANPPRDNIPTSLEDRKVIPHPSDEAPQPTTYTKIVFRMPVG